MGTCQHCQWSNLPRDYVLPATESLSESGRKCCENITRVLFNRLKEPKLTRSTEKPISSLYVFFRVSSSWDKVKKFVEDIQKSKEIENKLVQTWATEWKFYIMEIFNYHDQLTELLNRKKKATSAAERRKIDFQLDIKKAELISYVNLISERRSPFKGPCPIKYPLSRNLISFFTTNWRQLFIFADWPEVDPHAATIYGRVFVKKISDPLVSLDSHTEMLASPQVAFFVLNVSNSIVHPKGEPSRHIIVPLKVEVESTHFNKLVPPVLAHKIRELMQFAVVNANKAALDYRSRPKLPVNPIELQESTPEQRRDMEEAARRGQQVSALRAVVAQIEKARSDGDISLN